MSSDTTQKEKFWYASLMYKLCLRCFLIGEIKIEIRQLLKYSKIIELYKMNVNSCSDGLMRNVHIEIWKYMSSYTEKETIFTQKLLVNFTNNYNETTSNTLN